jgi:nitroreductase
MTLDLAVTDHLLATTRAVRRRLDLTREVPRELLLECIGLAQQAPTGSNSQAWRWVIVTDADKRRAIGEAYREGSTGYFRGAEKAVDDSQQGRVVSSALFLNEHLGDVPVHVIPCMPGRPEGLPNAHAAGWYGSILPAVWSFMLAARARGLGSSFTTLHLNREKQVAELLGIPDDVTQVALIPLGFFTGEDFRPADRPAPETIVHWDGWSG